MNLIKYNLVTGVSVELGLASKSLDQQGLIF